MPALPVLQNGFVAPGLGVGFNLGGNASSGVAALAAAWAPRTTVAMISGGVGADFGAAHGVEYGARVAAPLDFLQRRGPIGAVAFIGVGGDTPSNGGASQLDVPVGIGVGWRHALGATRGISVYVAPFYLYSRSSPSSESSTSEGSFRASLGTDLTLGPRLGLTLGGDAGTRGPGRIAAGVSYLLIH
jgi:hypothetical protein